MFQRVLVVVLMTFTMIAQATLPDDAIQRCLNVRRLADISTKQKMAAKEPGVLRFRFHKVPASSLPLDNTVGDMNEVISTLNNQIENCNKTQGEFQTITIAGQPFKRKEWCLDTNKKMLRLAQAAHGDFQKYLSSIKTEFDFYKSEGWPDSYAGFKKGDFHFTAYYAPAPIEAHKQHGGAFLYPIYQNPGVVKSSLNDPLCGIDPVSNVARGFCMKHANGTYTVAPDREEIGNGALHPKYIIGYVKNPNDLAVLMLQGSGSIRLDGQLFHLNYDGANGRPRTMLGRIVQCAQDPTCGGNIDTMEACAKNPKCHDEAKLRCNLSKSIRQSGASEKFIRQYLDHPLNRDKALDLRNRDQSFVFFAQENGGPYGSEKIALTPHGSCATDHKVIPIGMNFIYNFKKSTSWCVAQDAGGAIVGAHVDIYKGEGNDAGREATAVNHSGSLFVILPKKYKSKNA